MHRQQQQGQLSTLEDVISYLDQQYYVPIEQCCERATASILAAGEGGEAAAQYVLLSRNVVRQAQRYIRQRRHVLLPYAEDLSEKEDAGHDCRNCSSACTIRHQAQIWGISEIHARVKDAVWKLQVNASGAGSPAPEAIRSLQAEMAALSGALNGALQAEQAFLVPKLKEAQNNIHAHS